MHSSCTVFCETAVTVSLDLFACVVEHGETNASTCREVFLE